MIKNYFKIAFRNIRKNKAFAGINIFGLTIGLTCCLLIGLYIQHELNYDNFQLNGKRIARVIMEYKFDGGSESKKGNFTSSSVAPVFKQTFPEISEAVRMASYPILVQYNNKLINEKNFMFADGGFFNMFSFDLLKGDKATALDGPKKVVLTQSTAKRYFGDADPVGKTLQVGSDSSLYQVTGLMKDCPSNSQIKFDLLASFSSLNPDKEKTYWNANYTTFLLLKNEHSFAPLQQKIAPFMQKEMAGQGATVNFTLEPFNRIHLYSQFDGFEPNSSITYIHILEVVVLMILAIACFTYVNLSTARSMERAREVGVRKVIGAGKKQLFWQFMGESVLFCIIATILSIVAAALLMPVFNQLTDKHLQVNTLASPSFILACTGLIVVVSLLAGSYPALILSNFQPVKVLKGSFKNSGSGQWVRKSLIVFQFSISVVLVVATVIIQKQLNYIQNKKLGYSRDHVMVLPMEKRMFNDLPYIKEQLKANKNVLSVSLCNNTPVNIGSGYNMRSATMPENQQIAVTANNVDEEFIKTTGLQLIAGRDFTRQDVKDVMNDDLEKNVFHFILNEAAARELGWTPEQAIGKRMFLDASRPGFVTGVIKNFHFESLHTAIKPLVLFPQNRGGTLLVKLSGHNIAETVTALQSKWKTIVPYRPFEYHFLDDDFNRLYRSENRLGKVLNIFAGMAIALACLGLLGLSAYAAKQRTKEIGVRKILGAGVGNIAVALSFNFVKLVFVAIVIAMPVAWWLMKVWLQDFAYHTGVSWVVFALAGLAAISVAAVTIGIQAIKTALVNPIKSLRTE
ncbi:ABC transporter permease [Mucilaginibacter sp. AK015]|uniref:ABC transporter permease n=1 Tax=Mucilaginibacter sp. AK015 TaxID=2723072 RepID=UPI00161231BF|nr:ABC transporter permease [Mucilaginibacter sp. AK015]MBB5397689.1 putative ABC transport system permease protein [Mucilaginibacter sp. AK015]